MIPYLIKRICTTHPKSNDSLYQKATSSTNNKFRSVLGVTASVLVVVNFQPIPHASAAEQKVVPTIISYLLLSEEEKSSTNIIYRLPDSGLLLGGNYPSGINNDCSGVLIAQQSCSHGLDATHYDDSDGKAGFSYTKLSISGTELPADAESWACVRDNVTGFIWEVKTNDGGLQDAQNTYFWGGLSAEARDNPDAHGEYYDDWNPLMEFANQSALCGYADWRVPAIKELATLVDRGKRSGPSIDTNYFPNTQSWYYWSSTPAHPETNDLIGRARRIGFQDGIDRSWYRSGQYSHYHVRLVRTEDYKIMNQVGD